MSACQPCPKAGPPPPEKLGPPHAPVTVRASLFFDGTLNNRNNTETRMRGEADEDQLESASYTNDYSNIAKLERLLGPQAGYDLRLKFYVEGIGTEDDETDSLAFGASMGMGDTGIIAKVERGLDLLYTAIVEDERVSKQVPITHIHLDSFGFSRGAAAARHFIHKALHESGHVLRKRLESAGYKVAGVVKVRFVGLYDTVASHGIKHSNDTEDLSLDAVQHADKVVQLAAAEEHRKNYRLTNIDSAGGKGLQIFLPGVHSDIGGSYNALEDEHGLELFEADATAGFEMNAVAAMRREHDWFVQQGWYRADELHQVKSSRVRGNHRTDEFSEVYSYKLKGHPDKPRKMSNLYARIPLHMMAGYAKELGLTFTGDLNSRNAVPAKLAGIRAQLDDYAKKTAAGRKSSPDDWFHKADPTLAALRHEYLHFSAFYGVIMGANDPQFDRGETAAGARRQRTIQRG